MNRRGSRFRNCLTITVLAITIALFLISPLLLPINLISVVSAQKKGGGVTSSPEIPTKPKPPPKPRPYPRLPPPVVRIPVAKEQALRRGARAMDYLVNVRGIDRARVFVQIKEGDTNDVVTELWVNNSEKFDEYGPIHDCDEEGRLDNFVTALQYEPREKGSIIITWPSPSR